MSKIKSVIALLVLSSSSVAMADSSFTASARGSIRFGTTMRPQPTPTPIVVRDHRYTTNYSQPSRYTQDRYDARFENRFDDRRYEPVRTFQPTSTYIANQGCQNWDPTLNATACGAQLPIDVPEY